MSQINRRSLDGEWRKSNYSSQNGNCVEVAANPPGVVAVRDSKDREGPSLTFTPEAWRAFVRGVLDGQLS